jgi:competence protein ComEC
MKNDNVLSSLIFIFLIIFTISIFIYILFILLSTNSSRIYFLNVGEGDSELLILPSNIKIMTDAGPQDNVLSELQKILPDWDNYIDLSIISHPQLDHFNGFNYLLDHYNFGAFIINGREDLKVKEWKDLIQKIEIKKIPIITLKEGDSISFKENKIQIISPNNSFLESAELNDTALVEIIKTKDFKALLTSDIGDNVEKQILKSYKDIKSDILKVAHHGSKYSSSKEFLTAVNPKISVIEVGKNKYGHPSKEIIDLIASSAKSLIFRTDENGTIEIKKAENNLSVTGFK